MSATSDQRHQIEALRERLSALSAASLRISASLDLDTVLREIAATARALTGARYAVITTIDDSGRLEDAVIDGFTPEQARQITEWTDNMQVLEALRDLPSTVRVTDMPAYIGGLGYSTDGVIIKTFPGTPMRRRGEQLGNFFLAEKQTGPEFSDEDEEVLALFAAQAAAATANARTHRDERRARADVEALVETSPVGVAVFDGRTGRPVSFNRESRRLVEILQTPGHSCEQLIEAITFRLAEGREISLAKFPHALQLSHPETLRAEQLTLSVPDPRSVTALLSAPPIRDEHGELVSLVVTLQELERLRAEFLGMLSYERRARRGPTARRVGSAPACVARWQRPPSSASPCDTLRPFTRRPASRPRGAQARRAACGPHPPQTDLITRQIHLLGLSAALIGSLLVSPSLAQQPSKQQQQQIKRDIKAQQKAEEDADKRQELLQEVQPLADRFAEAMLTRKYSDSLVQGYLGSLGQSLVPPETPASTTFSFRVVQDIVPNAYALPDGRIYITTGMLAHVENEAQLAMVLGHEIGHVIEEHALESLRRQRSGQRRNKIVGAAAGAALGGLLGGKKGGGAGAAQGVAVGAAIGTFAATVANSVIRSKYSKEQEGEADRIGTELALERGFDPEEAARFWDHQHERFGKRSLTTKIEHSLFGSHPRDRVRAENVRALLAGTLKPAIDEKQAGDGLATGTPRFGSVISGLMRDTGTLMAERSDRHDLAIGLLEKARKHRPNDPRLLWALGRTYRMVARTDEKLAEADSLLATAAEQDRRGIYPAIHRDIAYAMASQSQDYATATGHLRQYVTGHIGVHGKLPSDIDDVYDKLVLFGDNEWVPAVADRAVPEQTLQAASGASYHPTVWHTPADLAAYDAALQASTEQIENSFGGVLADGQAGSE